MSLEVQGLSPRKIARYGWRRPLPDPRAPKFHDFRTVESSVALPTLVDLRAKCPPVYDQGDLGSCTGNALAGHVQFTIGKEGKKPWFTPSRLFIYYNERVIENSVKQDAGATIADGVTTLKVNGAPPESDWWYDVAKFAVKPNKKVYTEAAKTMVVDALSFDNTNLDALRTCLASGSPFVFGFSVYESFESSTVARTGVVPMPKSSEELLGGHAVMAVGYDHVKQVFIVRNSWGPDWGKKGYFTIPYAYITNPDMADDFWTISNIT